MNGIRNRDTILPGGRGLGLERHLSLGTYQGPQLITLLTQIVQLLQDLLVETRVIRIIFQKALVGAPTPLRSGAARENSITTTSYDIDNPRTLGTIPAHPVRNVASLEFAKLTAQFPVTDWLMAME